MKTPTREHALALVAMPWSFKDRPSAALSALAAYARRAHPEWQITCHSEFMHVAHSVGHALYDHIANATYSMGELFYMPLVYPERRDAVIAYFAQWAAEHVREPLPGFADWNAVGAHVLDRLARELASSAERLAGKTVVGLTTCFGQMFANIALSRAIKALHPETLVVLGGSTVSSRVGPSLLAEYGSIDYVIQGEGEEPLSRFLSAVERGENPADLGIVSREHRASSRLTEIGDMDDLPLPDFDEYAELAERYDVAWTLPIEGSRGCWWDRTARTGNPKSICYFCNLNVQWNGYREKSIARVTRELDEQSSRYENLRVFFLDNIIRHNGTRELARSFAGLKRDFNLFYEMRANVTPLEIVELWEAGLRVTQFGIEGLSTSFLKRIGKGTTAIQNLEAMRMCAELRITNNANLIVKFPGATAAEVTETVTAIERWALGFQPLTICPFFLGVDSSIDRLREEFGIVNVRNRDLFKIGLPEDVWRRLELFDLDFDLNTPPVDWTGVVEAQARWQEAHARRSGPLLYYQDGGSFLVVEDHRSPSFRQGRFNRLERDVYVYCTRVRRLESILAHAARRNGSESEVKEILAMFVEADIMCVEGDRYLSLAVATSPHLAARRVREQEASEERPKSVVRMAVLQ